MYDIHKLVDFSSWSGNWPFIHLRYKELDALQEKLQSINVLKSFVAPVEAVFEQDPLRANIQLLKDIKDEFFSPVLVVNLSYANWEECIDLALKDGRVKIIKLIPNYHMFELCEEQLEKLVAATSRNNLLVSLQVSIEDTRGQHPLLKVSDVEAAIIAKTLSYFPDQIFIINNAYYWQLDEILISLNNVYVDISSLETQGTLKKLCDQYGLDRFLFSTHCPFYYPEGNVNKLKYSELPSDEIDKVAYRNSEKLLNIKF